MKRALSFVLVLALLLTVSSAVLAKEKPQTAGGNLPEVREARLALKAARMLERSEADLDDDDDDNDALLRVKNRIQKTKPVEKMRLTKLALYPVGSHTSDQVLDEEDPFPGHVMIVAARGIHDLVIHGVIGDLEDGQTYDVWVRDLKDNYDGEALATAGGGYYKLTTFKADSEGHGNFHIKILDEDLEAGTYNLQVAINIGGSTIAATTRKEVTVD